MPRIVLSGPDGYSVQLASNNEATIIAWFNEWIPRLSDPEYPIRIWVTSPVWKDMKHMTEPDWSCDTRFLGTPLEVNSMNPEWGFMPGSKLHGLLLQHLEYIRKLEKADDERRGRNG